MKKIFFLLLVSSLFISCEIKLKKTNDLDSLLDYGFLEEPKVSLGKSEIIAEKPKPTTEAFNPVSSIYYGFDISHFQGDIVEKLKANKYLSFVICKATQGDYFTDPDFRDNWHEIKEKGLIRGTYHFYDCSADPIVQAHHFVSTISGIGINDIAPILDIEQGSMSKNVSGDKMVSDILVFLKEVERKLNRKPLLYTDYSFAQTYFKNSKYASKLAEYDLWLAEYSGRKKPKIPDVWKEKGYKIWQKSASYKEDSQKVDHDVYPGILTDLVK